MHERIGWRRGVAAAVLMLAQYWAAPAQEFMVTGASVDGGAWIDQPETERATLGAAGADQSVFEEGTVTVASDHQLMLISASNTVIIVLGPARFTVSTGDDRSELALEDGRVMLVSGWPEEGVMPLVVLTPADDSDGRMLEAIAAPGRCFFRRSGNQVEVGFASSGDLPPRMALKAKGEATSLASGDMLAISETGVVSKPAGDWLEQYEFSARWGVNLGVASAQSARPSLETRLFNDITTWEVYGGQEYVKKRIAAGRFRPELRQVVTGISTPQRPVSPPGAVPETSGFPAANEVPLLSPAALSVVNIAEGVTVIQLNNQARGLLTQTGSRGLGFRGLSQLAIPGFLGGGIPTVGPAGLGAQ